MPVLSSRTALFGALASLVGLVATGVLAYLIPVSHAHDSATLAGFEALNRPRVTPLLSDIAHLANPKSYIAIGLALVVVAALRRRPRVAAAILFLLFATGATTAVLKPLLAHPRFSEWLGEGQISAASWPSGHATAAMTLALCAVLAATPRSRPTVATIGALFAVAVSYSILALGWHFPSDVVGGFFVASTWTLLAVAALVRWPGRTRARTSGEFDSRGPVIVAGATAGVAGLIVLARPQQVADFALARPSFVIGATVIAVLAAAMAVGFARALRP